MAGGCLGQSVGGRGSDRVSPFVAHTNTADSAWGGSPRDRALRPPWTRRYRTVCSVTIEATDDVLSGGYRIVRSDQAHRQHDGGGVFCVVEDLLVGRAEVRRAGQRFTGPSIADEQRVCTARHLKADPVAMLEGVCRRPHADSYRDRTIGGPIYVAWAQPNDPIAEILGSTSRGHVAEADEEVGVIAR